MPDKFISLKVGEERVKPRGRIKGKTQKTKAKDRERVYRKESISFADLIMAPVFSSKPVGFETLVNDILNYRRDYTGPQRRKDG